MNVNTGSTITLDAAVAEQERIYLEQNPNSANAYKRAQRVMPGGNSRSALYFDPFPFFVEKASDAFLLDIDGNRRIDFSNDLTAALYGHSHPVILNALKEIAETGHSYGACHAAEIEFAEEICRRFASIELVRFCTSGGEANAVAVQLARAATGRQRILAFRGGYHGSMMSFVRPGNRMNLDEGSCLFSEYNSLADAKKVMDAHGDEVAAIIVEPILGSGGGILGSTTFLRGLRAISDEFESVLVFDEVQTARLATGGYQSVIKVRPDLTTLGKFVGGGLNFGAVGGRRDLMERLSPLHLEKLPHGGTFNNNVATMKTGLAALQNVLTSETIQGLNCLGDRLRGELERVAAARKIPFKTGSFGSLVSTHFQSDLPQSPREISTSAKYRKLFQLYMINSGLFLARRGQYTLSVANDTNQVSTAVDVFDGFLEAFGHLSVAE